MIPSKSSLAVVTGHPADDLDSFGRMAQAAFSITTISGTSSQKRYAYIVMKWNIWMKESCI
jgi:hypothetical protein